MEISEKVTIKIPGLSKEKRFLHISDAHITKVYAGDSIEEQNEQINSVKRWNDNGIPAHETFCEFLKFAEVNNPDLVLMAGDMIDYYTESNVKYLKELLSGFQQDYLYVWGNHEHGSYGLNLPDMKVMRENIAPMMQGETEFYIKDFGDFLIVCIDNSKFDITDNQLNKMKEASKLSKPILLLMHIPLWTEEFEKVAWSMLDKDAETTENARAFAEFIRSEESGVIAVIAGHEHFEWSGEFAKGRMQYVSAPLFKRFIREIRIVAE